MTTDQQPSALGEDAVAVPPVSSKSSEPGQPKPKRIPDWARQSLQIFGVASLAIAQPLLALLGENPTYFVAHGAGPLDIVTFAVAIVLLPALAFIIPVLLVRLISRRAGDIAAAIAIGILATLVLLGAFDRLSTVRIRYWLAILAMGTALVALCYMRLRVVRLFALYLGFAPVLFVAMFLFTSGVQPLVFEDDPDVLAVSPSKTPVIFLVFDELPLGGLLRDDGTINSDRFPGFAQLAAVSTWYPRATTVSSETHAAIPALLTGRYPEPGVPPVAGQYPRSLFTMLGGSRELHVGEVMTSLCPEQLCTEQVAAPPPASLTRDTAIVAGHQFLPANLAERWFPKISATWANFGDQLESAPLPQDDLDLEFQDWFSQFRSEFAGRDPDVVTFGTWLASISSQQPDLWYQHLMLPHLPHQYLPDGRRYQAPHPPRAWQDGWFVNDPLATINEHQRLLLQMKFVDTLVSTLLDRLREQDMLDDSLVVVAADHGIGVLPGGHFRAHHVNTAEMASTAAGVDPYDAVVPVPLFVKYPGQTSGSVDDRDAQSIDVLPTIVDVFNLSLPDEWSFDGHSLLADPPSSTVLRVVVNGTEWVELPTHPEAVRLAKYMTDLLGPYRGQHDVYAVGPYGDLVGQPVESAGSPVAGASIALEDAERLSNVDLDGDSLPVYLAGNVTGLASGSWVALALNGTVAGLDPVYLDHQGQPLVEFMIDPTLMRDGENHLELYVVDPATDTLLPVATT